MNVKSNSQTQSNAISKLISFAETVLSKQDKFTYNELAKELVLFLSISDERTIKQKIRTLIYLGCLIEKWITINDYEYVVNHEFFDK